MRFLLFLFNFSENVKNFFREGSSMKKILLIGLAVTAVGAVIAVIVKRKRI